MEKTIPGLFMMLKAAEVEIKKEHQVLMVNKTTSFKKKGKGKKKGNFKKNDKQVVTPGKKPKNGPKPETECFYCKGTGHWKWNCPKYLEDKKDGKVSKGIFDTTRNRLIHDSPGLSQFSEKPSQMGVHDGFEIRHVYHVIICPGAFHDGFCLSPIYLQTRQVHTRPGPI